MVLRILCLLVISLPLPAAAQYHSNALPRSVVVEEHAGETVVHIGLPAVVVYAAAAEAHGPDLAPMLFRKWASEPHGLDLLMFSGEPTRFAPLLKHAVQVLDAATDMEFRLLTISAHRFSAETIAQPVAAGPHPPITEIWIEARFAARGQVPVTVNLRNLDLPLDYHFETLVTDERHVPANRYREIGHLKGALTLFAPE